MTSPQQTMVKRYPRLIIGLSVLIALFVMLAALSYFWLPGYAKSQLEKQLSLTLQHPVTIGSIEIKPQSLEIIVHGVTIGWALDENNEKVESLFSFNRLQASLSLESLKQRVPIFTAITLVDPRLHLVRISKDRFNFSDLLEQFLSSSDDDQLETAIKFSISNLTIQDGHVEFVDQFTQTKHNLSEINFTIPAISNFERHLADWIEPHFTAKINETPVSLVGKLRLFIDHQEALATLKLDRFDLKQITPYLSLPDGIHLLTGAVESDLSLSFSQSSGGKPDMTLTGTTSLHQVRIKNNAVPEPYQVSLKQMSASLSKMDLTGKTPALIRLAVQQAALLREGESDSALSFAHLNINRIAVNTQSQHVAIGEIILDRLNTTLRRESDGQIDWFRLFNLSNNGNTQVTSLTESSSDVRRMIPTPGRKPVFSDDAIDLAEMDVKSPAPIATIQSAKQVESASKSSSWNTQIKSIKLKSATLRFEDLTLTEPAPMVMDDLNITLDNIDLNGIKPLNMNLQAQVNQRGHMAIDGLLAWAPLTADLTLSLAAIDLVSLQGWIADKVTALLTSGELSFEGNIKAQDDPLKLQVLGHINLANVNLFNAQRRNDLLRWKNLDINDLNFINAPLRVDINTMHFNDFYARMTILPDGSLNLSHIIKQDPVETDSPSTASADRAPNTDPPDTPIHIHKIILKNGNINFNDRFIKPNYRANLTGLSGLIGPLAPGLSGEIDIKGALDRSAPLEIKGTVDLFSADFFLDLVTRAEDIDLPPFSPYAEKYIGYAIEKGKLSADVHYRVEKGNLTAENQIFLDQLTLGDEVESENALSLPLDLAITLLKNRRGEINLHIPLQGSINDPQFNHFGEIIIDAFTNLIMKALTSPFSLLSALFEGDSEELAQIVFAPGFAEIEPEAEIHLQALTEIMNDRSSLRLEIYGHADPLEDYAGLKLATLQSRLKAQKLADDAKRGITGGSITTLTLTPEEYNKYVEITYKNEQFIKPKNILGLTKKLSVDEMQDLLLANIEIIDQDLEALAERRAIAALNWLVEHGRIANDRIFMVDAPKIQQDEDKKGNRVDFLFK